MAVGFARPYFFARTQKQRRKTASVWKTVIRNFLGTGMILVMPVLLLSVHPQE